MILEIEAYVPIAATTAPKKMYNIQMTVFKGVFLFSANFKKQALGIITDIVIPKHEPINAMMYPKNGTANATSTMLETIIILTAMATD